MEEVKREKTLLEKIDHAKGLIKDYVEKYDGRYTFAFSGGKDSTVMAHLAMSVLGGSKRERMRLDAILADTEFEETHDFITNFSQMYGVKINRHFYINDPEKPEEASKENKVEKFKKVLEDVDCWFAGIRKDESGTRLNINDVEEENGLVKVNPIADFTEKDVWRYLAIYNVPVNTKYKDGYRSLSCKLSSAPEEDGNESERNGRWKGTADQGLECGIHSQPMRGDGACKLNENGDSTA